MTFLKKTLFFMLAGLCLAPQTTKSSPVSNTCHVILACGVAALAYNSFSWTAGQRKLLAGQAELQKFVGKLSTEMEQRTAERAVLQAELLVFQNRLDTLRHENLQHAVQQSKLDEAQEQEFKTLTELVPQMVGLVAEYSRYFEAFCQESVAERKITLLRDMHNARRNFDLLKQELNRCMRLAEPFVLVTTPPSETTDERTARITLDDLRVAATTVKDGVVTIGSHVYLAAQGVVWFGGRVYNVAQFIAAQSPRTPPSDK